MIGTFVLTYIVTVFALLLTHNFDDDVLLSNNLSAVSPLFPAGELLMFEYEKLLVYIIEILPSSTKYAFAKLLFIALT